MPGPLRFVALCAATCWFTVGTAAASLPPPDSVVPGQRIPFELNPTPPEAPRGTPAVLVPPGCVTPPPAVAVFEGQAELVRGEFARFRVDRLLAGSLSGWAVGGRVDLAYGVDARFLEEGGRYIVGTAPRAEDGRLTSSVRTPQPLFGGDAVIGADDSDVECPVVDDPVRTLMADGTAVESGLFRPLQDSGDEVLRALVVPLAVASLVLLVLVALKQLVWAMFRPIAGTKVVGAPTSRAGRRRHRSTDQSGAQRRP